MVLYVRGWHVFGDENLEIVPNDSAWIVSQIDNVTIMPLWMWFGSY